MTAAPLATVGPISLPWDDETLIIGLRWPVFLAYMRDRWHPGQHIAMVGPTGEGKTTLAGGLLSTRKWVAAFDPKGEDETLTASGFERVTTVPTDLRGPVYRARNWQAARQWDHIENRVAELRPVRIIIGQAARTPAQDLANQDLMRRAFAYVREVGGWTVYVDELELVSSPQMFGQGPQINRMLITARRDGTSVVTSYQAQAWVSKHAIRQATFAVIWRTGDEDMIDNVARGMGRDRKFMRRAVAELPPFHVLVIPKGRGPLICTSAPKL